MSGRKSLLARVRALAGRIWPRFLLVNVVVMLVPIAGLEFARIYERELLSALERDMNDQAALTRAVVEADLRAGVALSDPRHTAILAEAARRTRTRVRVVDENGAVVADSHEGGAPEGPEPEPRRLFVPDSAYDSVDQVRWRGVSTFPAVAERVEIRAALAGRDATQTRVARRPSAVFLFAATPVRGASGVAGAVYVTRSTAPVLEELYKIRSRLFRVLGVGLGLGFAITLLLALSISRPITLLSSAARRIARGERGVPLPLAGTGEIRELSESFRTMTEELDARLTYISDFSADVAHEFKSPLTAIRGAAELLAEGAHEDPAARARFLGNILLDVERLDRLVSRLLVLGRIEASAEEMTLVDLRSLLERLAARTAERAPVENSYAASGHWVRGRKADLEMAFGNLLENAERYSPEGRSIGLSAVDAEGGIVVSVVDHGPGIPEGRIPRLFERFYTTEGDTGGTGLGLAIVDSVARAHGGRVTVSSREGAGATFSVWLPGVS